MAHEPLRWAVHTQIDKWDPEQVKWAQKILGTENPSGDQLAAILKPAEVTECAGNLLTTAGLARLTSLLTGAGGQAITTTSARYGAGDSNTAEAVGQTDLQAAAGSTHRWFQIMDATYPTTSNGVVTLKATFASGDGNFAWAEWGIDVGAPTVTSGNTVAALLFNRKVQSQGTKVSGAVWAPTTTITIA